MGARQELGKRPTSATEVKLPLTGYCEKSSRRYYPGARRKFPIWRRAPPARAGPPRPRRRGGVTSASGYSGNKVSSGASRVVIGRNLAARRAQVVTRFYNVIEKACKGL